MKIYLSRQRQHEKLLALQEMRTRELELLAQSRTHADPRYVQDVVGFIWENLLQRKLRNPDPLAETDRRRLQTLASLLKAA